MKISSGAAAVNYAKFNMLRKIYLASRVIFWCGLIFYLSGIPNLNTGMGVWDFVLRKCAHMVVFGILFIFTYSASNETLGIDREKSYFYALIFSIIYAMSDEYHQSFVPGRNASAIDVMIDSAGVFAALILKKRSQKTKDRRIK